MLYSSDRQKTTLCLETGPVQLQAGVIWEYSVPFTEVCCTLLFSSSVPSTADRHCRALCFRQEQDWQISAQRLLVPTGMSRAVPFKGSIQPARDHLYLSITLGDTYLGPSQELMRRSQNLERVLIHPNSPNCSHSTPMIPQCVLPAFGMHGFVICNC